MSENEEMEVRRVQGRTALLGSVSRCKINQCCKVK